MASRDPDGIGESTSTHEAAVNTRALTFRQRFLGFFRRRNKSEDPFDDYYHSEGQFPAPKRVEVAREPLPATGRPRPTTLNFAPEDNVDSDEDRLLAAACNAMSRAVEVTEVSSLARLRAFFARIWALFYKRKENDDGDEETVCCSCFVVARHVDTPPTVPPEPNLEPGLRPDRA